MAEQHAHLLESFRTQVSERVCVRLPPSSHSFRAILRAICSDEQTPVDAIRMLDETIVARTDAVANWHRVVVAVGKPSLLRALFTVIRECSTGPITAYTINWSHEEALRQRASVHRMRDQQRAGSEWEMQRAQQAILERFVDSELTSPHERRLQG